MSESQLIGDAVETVITDEALHLAHEAAEPTTDEVTTPGISKAAHDAFLRTKKATIAQNEKARRIVAELRERRENTPPAGGCSPLCGQTMISEFG